MSEAWKDVEYVLPLFVLGCAVFIAVTESLFYLFLTVMIAGTIIVSRETSKIIKNTCKI